MNSYTQDECYQNVGAKGGSANDCDGLSGSAQTDCRTGVARGRSSEGKPADCGTGFSWVAGGLGGGPEEAQERCRRSDCAERGEEALEFVRRSTARLLDRLFHDVARTAHVAQVGRQDLAQGGILRKLVEYVCSHALALIDRDHLLEQGRRHDLFRAKRHGTLDDQGNRDDRSQQKRVDRPACGLNDRSNSRRHRHGCRPGCRVFPSPPYSAAPGSGTGV